MDMNMKSYKPVIWAFLLVLMSLLMNGCDRERELLNYVNQRDANEIISILQKNGIESSKISNKKGGTFLIRTSKEDFSKSLRILSEYGFPKKKEVNLNDLFKKEGLVSSPLEDKVRYIYGLEAGIQDTLSQIDGVISAKVHIVIPDNDPFQEKISPSSAAVFIKHRANVSLSSLKISIKILVEKSIAGLSYDKVSLVLIPAKTYEEESVLSQSVNPVSNLSWSVIVLTLLLFFSWLFIFVQYLPSQIRERMVDRLPFKNNLLGTHSD